ncbi:hypothetical protein FHS85_001688 [Rhodoligotrophos appendicifer]|uniref:hypothetical protein n=1 Tax=Rhodoligotrophos appendicifer TaxID=987056 RepID=UPI00118630B3|nr:hypothetical protein [Rhodoligotrophos appendicifer]
MTFRLLFASCLIAATVGHAQAAEDVRSVVKAGCGTDYMKFCAAVPPTGNGMKALQCLLDNRKKVSNKCQSALLKAKEMREAKGDSTETAPEAKPTTTNFSSKQ